MAEIAKYQLIPNGGNILSDFKGNFSLFKTRKSSVFVYGVVSIFVAFTLFIAFTPSSSSSSSSPWFINIFTVNTSSSTTFSDESYRSHFSSIFSYFFPNSTNEIPQFSSKSKNITTFQLPKSNNEDFKPNKTLITPQNTSRSHNITNDLLSTSKPTNKTQIPHDKTEDLKPNQTLIHPISNSSLEIGSPEKQSKKQYNQSPKISPVPEISNLGSGNLSKNGNGKEEKVVASDFVASLSKKENSHGNGNGSFSGDLKKQGKDEEEKLVSSLVNCDLYDGKWVRDDSYPLYKPGSCSLIDEQFNCFLNDRPDNDYQKLKWKPKGCTLPRLNGGKMLEFLRGKRLVFVGDSLNRNMWESLVCILRNSVKDQRKVYEAFGRHSFRTEASYSFVFKDYNCTVEFFVSPFLVQQWETKDKKGTIQETLRLDLMVRDADEFKNADIIVFNTGHWWTHDKTSKGEDYYQEGSHVYKQLDVVEAFRRALTTWARWVDANVNPHRTHVLFRGYSESHFSGGQWNSGGQCNSEKEPIKNETYLREYPWKMKVFEKVIKGMKTSISYLNVTKMTDYRKDAHPSIYRKQHLSEEERKSPLMFQDCSHWCLPGVPDLWNELLYAELLRKQYMDQQQKNKT